MKSSKTCHTVQDRNDCFFFAECGGYPVEGNTENQNIDIATNKMFSNLTTG